MTIAIALMIVLNQSISYFALDREPTSSMLEVYKRETVESIARIVVFDEAPSAFDKHAVTEFRSEKARKPGVAAGRARQKFRKLYKHLSVLCHHVLEFLTALALYVSGHNDLRHKHHSKYIHRAFPSPAPSGHNPPPAQYTHIHLHTADSSAVYNLALEQHVFAARIHATDAPT